MNIFEPLLLSAIVVLAYAIAAGSLKREKKS